MRVTSAGLKGADGKDGKDGVNGTNGTNGTNATTTAVATTSANGLMSSADKSKLDRKQAKIIVTDNNGLGTWTFGTEFPTGVTPVIEVTPQNNVAGVTVNHKITALTNKAVSVQITLTSAVTLLGISVLGVSAASATTLHLSAEDPT